MRLRIITLALASSAAMAAVPAHATIISGTNSTFAQVDAASTTRSIVFADPGTIADLNITIDFTKCDDTLSSATCTATGYSYNREIVFQLTSPLGTTVNLVNEDTYSGQTPGDRVTVTFDDAAGSLVGGPLLLDGTFRPVGSLAAFNGQAIAGTWTLLIQDTVGLDPLRMNSFTIDIEPVPEPGTLLLLGSGITGLAVRRRRRG